MGKWGRPHLEETQEWEHGGESPEAISLHTPCAFSFCALNRIGLVPDVSSTYRNVARSKGPAPRPSFLTKPPGLCLSLSICLLVRSTLFSSSVSLLGSHPHCNLFKGWISIIVKVGMLNSRVAHIRLTYCSCSMVWGDECVHEV